MYYESEIAQSVTYLGSAQALRSLDADAYWPKWDSPWWHMLLLHEMGQTSRIPQITVQQFVESLDRLPVKILPIHPGDLPQGVDPYRGSPCHCQLGNVYQVLAAWGLDVDAELPWIRPWFLRYQMTDGGMNCDGAAYLVQDECPSSMVGTIPAFEAVLRHTPRPYSVEEQEFLDRAAGFLIGRKLMLGSTTRHNAAERVGAPRWLQPCFPRFYLYDVLRGLAALIEWAEKTNRLLPAESIRDVTTYLDARCPDGAVRIERAAFDGVGTLLQSETGVWTRRQAGTMFPLLTAVSVVGQKSPYLSQQWADAKRRACLIAGD
jgi:hypothetical protein